MNFSIFELFLNFKNFPKFVNTFQILEKTSTFKFHDVLFKSWIVLNSWTILQSKNILKIHEHFLISQFF